MLRCTAIGNLTVAVKRKPKPRIAFLREKAGLTQLELSRLVGVTESTIQNWESGRTGTDHIERIIKFCKALDCRVEDLIEYISESHEESASKPSSLTEIQNLLGTEEPSLDKSKREVSQKRKAKK
jgi:transcriptional regulator with XRE-family HTH domain